MLEGIELAVEGVDAGEAALVASTGEALRAL
jgi:hypothetical protein